ncbi:hypothetical protein BWI15_28865 [Kribbella sp. ALI-6-A]|nr:hypothetical protein BWI15_28865 [Kribbella sp. ALI-6-A]
MPDLQRHPRSRRHLPVAAPVQKSGPMPVASPVAPPSTRPESVHVRIGGRWIAGQALSRRTAPTGAREILISHHGHLVWVDQDQVRTP